MKIHASLRLTLLIILIPVALSACSSDATPTSQPVQPPATCPLPVTATPCPTAVSPTEYLGMWISESQEEADTRQVLSISETSLYWLQTGNWADVASQEGVAGGVHEDFFEIVAADPDAGHLTLRKKWVRTDGLFGGFDSPTWYMTYSVADGAIRFSLSTEGFQAAADSQEYFRK